MGQMAAQKQPCRSTILHKFSFIGSVSAAWRPVLIEAAIQSRFLGRICGGGR